MSAAVRPFFAMDTCFYSSQGSYGLDARCEMLRELGYDGTYLTLGSDVSWDDLARLAEVAARNELAIGGVYAVLDLAEDASGAANRRLFESAPLFAGLGRVELALRDSGQAGDGGAARGLVEELLERLPGDVEVCLYPHVGFRLERFDQAVELARAVDSPRLGVCFCAYHWYAVRPNPLDALLASAGGLLRSANVCGSRRVAGGLPTIEPLDDGDLDVFALLGALERAGYRGMVGLQGYGMGGDSYAKLERSLAAYRSATARLAAHPDWAALRP